MFNKDTKSYFGHVSALVRLESEKGMLDAVLQISLNGDDELERLKTWFLKIV